MIPRNLIFTLILFILLWAAAAVPAFASEGPSAFAPGEASAFSLADSIRNPRSVDGDYPHKIHRETPARILTGGEYDPAHLEAILRELDENYTGKNADPLAEEKLQAAVGQLTEELETFQTCNVILEARYSADVSDRDLSRRVLKQTAEFTDLTDRAFLCLSRVANGPMGDVITRDLSVEDAEYLREYVPETEEVKALDAKEKKLVHRYMQIIVEDRPIKKLNSEAGAILMKLVRVRQAIAREEGYDSYPEYADEVLYGRDYTAADLARLRASVKKDFVPAITRRVEAYEDMSIYHYHHAKAGEILNDFAPCIGRIDPQLKEAFNYLRRNRLYDFDESQTKADTGYTDTLALYGSALIFNRACGDKQDYDTMIHEFGHYNALYHDDQNVLLAVSCLDVEEIHSQGLELLFLPYYGELFGEDAGVYHEETILNIMDSVASGCLYDEFQRYVYAHPDMTVDQLNGLYRKLLGEYGVIEADAKAEEDPETSMDWIFVNHTFDLPMYYVSYATSALSALDLYLQSLEDRQAAVDTYIKLTSLGTGTPYREAIHTCRMSNIFDPRTVQRIAGELAKRTLEPDRDGQVPFSSGVNPGSSTPNTAPLSLAGGR